MTATLARRSDVDTALLISMRDDVRSLTDPRWRQEALRDAERQLGLAWWFALHTRPVRWYVAVEGPDGNTTIETQTDHVARDVTAGLDYLDRHSAPGKVRRDPARRLPHHHTTDRTMFGDHARYRSPISEAFRALVLAAAARYLDAVRDIEARHAQSLADNAGRIADLEARIARAEAAANTPQ